MGRCQMAWDHEGTLQEAERRGPQAAGAEDGCSHTPSSLPPQPKALALGMLGMSESAGTLGPQGQSQVSLQRAGVGPPPTCCSGYTVGACWPAGSN